MANQVDKVNGIAIASIDKVNGMTDANIQAFNSFEFAGVTFDGLTWATGGTYASRASNAFWGSIADGFMVGGYN